MRLASDCMTSGPLQQGLLLHDNVDSEDGGEIGMERDGFMNVFSVEFLFFPSFSFFSFFSCIEADRTFGRIVGGGFENWHNRSFRCLDGGYPGPP